MFAARKIFLYIGLSFIALFFTLHIIVNQTRLNTQIKQLIEEKAEKAIGTRLKLDHVTLNLFTMNFSFDGVAFLYQKDKLKLNFMAEEVTARLSFWDFIFGELKLAALTSYKAKIYYEDFALKKKKGISPFSFNLRKIPVGSFVLTESQINYGSGTEEKTKIQSLKIAYLGLEQSRGAMLGSLQIASYKANKDLEDSFEIKGLNSNIYLNNDYVALNKLQLLSRGSEFGGSAKIHFRKDDGKITGLELSSHLNSLIDLDENKKHLSVEVAEGKFRVYGHFTGKYNFASEKFSDLFFNGEAESKQAVIEQFKLFDSHLKFTVDNQKILVKKLSLIKNQKEIIAGSGLISLDKIQESFALKASVDSIKIQEIFEFLNAEGSGFDFYTSTDNLLIETNFNPFSLKIRGPLRLDEFKIKSLEAGIKPDIVSSCQFNLEVDVFSDHLSFLPKTKGLCSLVKNKDTSQAINAGDLSIQGKIPFKGDFNLKFSSKKQNYRFLSTFLPIAISGEGLINLDLAYVKGDIETTVDFSGEKFSISNIPLAKSSGKIFYRGSELHLNEFKIFAEQGGIDGTGVINFTKNDFSLNLSSAHVDKQAFEILKKQLFPDIPIGFSLVHLQAHLKGPLIDPLGAHGTFNFLSKNILWEDDILFEDLSVSLLRNDKGIFVSDFHGEYGHYIFGADGSILKAEQSNLGSNDYFLKELDLSYKDKFNFTYYLTRKVGALLPTDERTSEDYRIPYFSKPLEAVGINLFPSFQGSFKGDFSNYKLIMDGHFTGVTYLQKRDLPDFSFDLVLDQNKLEGSLEQVGKEIKAKISIDRTKGEKPFSFDIILDQFNARDFLSSTIYDDPRNFAYVSLALKTSGSLKEKQVNKFFLDIKSLYAEYFSELNETTKIVNVKMDGPYQLDIDRSSKLNKSRPLSIYGDYFDIKFSGLDTLLSSNQKVNVIGDINLEVLKYLYPDITLINGLATLNGKFENVNDKLTYSFNLKNKDLTNKKKSKSQISMVLYDIKPEFKDLDFDFKLTESYFAINKLTAVKGDGSVNASGKYFFDNSGSLSDLTFNLNNASFLLDIPYLKEIETKINGQLNLKGKKAPYFFTGNLEVSDMSSRMNYNFIQEAIKTAKKRQIKRSIDSFVREDFLKIDVGIESNKSVNIFSKDLNITASGALRIQGTDSNYYLSGMVKTDKGEFNYKHPFNIEKCEVVFDKSDDLNPSLHVKAHSMIDNYKVTFNILGRALDPWIELDIYPRTSRTTGDPITNLQILSLISQGSFPKSDVDSSDFSAQDGLVEGTLNYAKDFLPLNEFLSRDYSGLSLRTQFRKTKDGTALNLVAFINLMKDLDLRVTGSSSSTVESSLNFQMDNNISASANINNDDSTPEADARVNFDFSF